MNQQQITKLAELQKEKQELEQHLLEIDKEIEQL